MNELDETSFQEWLQEANRRAETALKAGVHPDQVGAVLEAFETRNLCEALSDLNELLHVISVMLEDFHSSNEL